MEAIALLIAGIILGAIAALGWLTAGYWKGRHTDLAQVLATTTKVLSLKEQTIDAKTAVIKSNDEERKYLIARAELAEDELAQSRRALVVQVTRKAGEPWPDKPKTTVRQ